MLTAILIVLVLSLAYEYRCTLQATRGLSELPDRQIILGRLLILGNPNKRSKRHREKLSQQRERIEQIRRQ